MSIERVLVVDDETIMRHFLVEALKRKGMDAVAVESGEKAEALIQLEAFDLVITDMKMGKMSGMELLQRIKEISPRTLVIVITAFGTIENAVEAMKKGAFHYILKPFSVDSLMANIEKGNQHMALVQENQYLREQTAPQRYREDLVAASAPMKELLGQVEQIAKSHSSVMISGETGTGKEVIAHLIHYGSSRAGAPFIKVNCAAIPESLIESEFFGHEKGAFTGASAKKPGRFELADGGTLFLDEVTEIPPWLQAKLLRAIQEKEFYRVGGVKPVEVDVRLISTTNRDLGRALEEKALREDLYYRLNVIPLRIPPLRERQEDILPLACYFMKRMSLENHLLPKKLSRQAEAKLLAYRWPGNVRELSNVIERAVVMSKDEQIEAEQLYLDSAGNKLFVGKRIDEVEKELIEETVRAHDTPAKAAETLGISLKTLRSKLQSYQI